MYGIIVAFIIIANGLRGEGLMDDHYATIQACEMARVARVEGFRRAMEQIHHDVVVSSSYCGLPSSLGAEGV